MKIQQTTEFNLNSKRQNPSQTTFTGAEVLATQVLRFLETNQAWGATGVDVGCMGLPRTAVDFTRGPAAGVETARREFSSTANNSLIGTYGLVSAWGISHFLGLNKKFGVKAKELLIDSETLEILSNAWQEKNGNLKGFLEDVLKNTSTFNPDKVTDGRVKIDSETRKSFIERFSQDLNKSDKNEIKATKEYLKSLILDATGSETKFEIKKEIKDATVKSVSSLDDYIDNLFKSAKAFSKVSLKDIKSGHFVKALQGLNKGTAIAGLAVAGLVGVSLQPINMYLTRKQTGQKGFVGVAGREPDNSKGFKILKTGAAIAAAALAMCTISKSPVEILKKVQFKGLIPQIDQFKFVYGVTIASRLLSARDKNELREASFKDSLGFVNWLILGGFVSKLAALGIEKLPKFKEEGVKFLRHEKDTTKTGWFSRALDWIQHSSIITRDEVLHDALKNTIKDNKAMSFKEMMKIAAKEAPEATSKIRALGAIQLAGYIYSGVVLGVGIPKLNIAMTKLFNKPSDKKTSEKTI